VRTKDEVRAMAQEPDTETAPHVAAELSRWGSYDRDNPYPVFAAVQELGTVHPVTLADGHSAYLVVGHEQARLALKDARLSKDMQAAFTAEGSVVAEGLPGPDFAHHMLAVDPPDHTRLRGLVASVFTAQRVEALRPRIQMIIDDLLDAIASAPADEPVDLVAQFAFPLPFTVISELLGVPPRGRDALEQGLQGMLVPIDTPEKYAAAKVSSDSVVAQLHELVRTKRESPGDDLVSALVMARDGNDGLNDLELLSSIFQLIVAGHDTTATLISNSVVAMLRHPATLASLRAQPELMPQAVEEFMRYDAPVPHATFRYAREDMQLGDHMIPAGEQVIISLAAASRDPERFSDPAQLDIQRDQGSHMAFGHGVHHCLGAPLARLEGEMALHTLLRRFPEFRLAEDAELHWDHGDGLVLRRLSSLPIVAGPSLPRPG
jgi:cytochrome P450